MNPSFLTRLHQWIRGRLGGKLSPYLPGLWPKKEKDTLEVPMIPLLGHVILPGAVQLLHVPEMHIQNLLEGYSKKKNLVAMSHTRAFAWNKGKSSFKNPITVIGEILEVSPQTVASGLASQGLVRASVVEFVERNPLPVARVRLIPDSWGGVSISREKAKERLLELLGRWAFLKGSEHPELLTPIRGLVAERICDLFAFYGLKDTAQKQEVLELTDGEQRFAVIEKVLITEIARMEKFPAVQHFAQNGYSIH